MVNLISHSPAQGLLPLTMGQVQVTEVTGLSLTTLAPYRGKDAVGALKDAHGLEWPGPNGTSGTVDRAVWFGHSHILLMGPLPDPSLSDSCAIVDQSDAWTVVDVTGAMARDVLARLTPMDLRDAAFPVGAAARTELQHMQGCVIRIGGDQYRLMVFRSMAHTLVHDLKTAMESVAALFTK
ncbi:MAG: sarcosine oxidase subunit gamma family protein [Pseudomonadota bacterium]